MRQVLASLLLSKIIHSSYFPGLGYKCPLETVEKNLNVNCFQTLSIEIFQAMLMYVSSQKCFFF